MELNHTDDAGIIMQKLLTATNEVTRLTEELISVGTELNKWNGKFHELKARIKTEKEKINSLKFQLRAEGSHL